MGQIGQTIDTGQPHILSRSMRAALIFPTRLFPAIALVLTLPALALAADDQSRLLLELNNAEDQPSGHCQLTFLTENSTTHDITRAAWQFAILDAEGHVRALPVIDFGALPPGKTRAVTVELPGRSCTQISRIVVNDVAECETGAQTSGDICLSDLVAQSRVAIAFGL